MIETVDKRCEGIAAASGAYSLLARLWLQEVDHCLIVQLQETALGDAFRAAGGVVPDLHEIDDLATEYCRLFIGPKDHLPPLQSVWARGELQSDITTSVRAFAEAAHYQPAPGIGNPMFDHLGVQMDIMSRATQLVSRGVPENDSQLAFAAEFFRRHLSWPQDLLSAANRRVSHSFYVAIVGMTTNFLRDESEFWLGLRG